MAEQYRFFDPAEGDIREYAADDFAQFFTNFLGNGFFRGLSLSTNDNMTLTLASGSAFIEGYQYTNTSNLDLTHDSADATNDRIDRIVLRLDKRIEYRDIRAFVKKGDTATHPVPPELTRNDYIYELSLAQIKVTAGKSFIDSSQITDERGDNQVCGRVQVAREVGDQITTVDVKRPSDPPERYSEGLSQFYLHGSNDDVIFQEWLDSIGISASKYGRPLSSLRAYIHTMGNRTNTGVQTITIFAWDYQSDYQIYGKFERANNAVSSSIDWGRWQEARLIAEQGSNSNGEYVRYTDGVQECWGSPAVGATNDPAGALYRSDFTEWFFPRPFLTAQNLVVRGDIRSFDRWITVSGVNSERANVSAIGVYNSNATYGTMVHAIGRWR